MHRRFNPRSRGASDQRVPGEFQKTDKFQSTLARGERPTSQSSAKISIARFNPRSRGASDAYERNSVYDETVFQSTLARGERRAHFAIGQNDALVSIHARAGRATQSVSPTEWER